MTYLCDALKERFCEQNLQKLVENILQEIFAILREQIFDVIRNIFLKCEEYIEVEGWHLETTLK